MSFFKLGNSVKTSIVSFRESSSSKDIITWNKNSQNQLRDLDPGESRSVSFSVSPLPLFSTAGEILTNPSINIDIDVSGKQSVEGFSISELANSSSAVVRIISDVGFSISKSVKERLKYARELFE